MKVKLISYMAVSKIDAVKCVRDVVPSLNLQMSKTICESLPFEIEVKPERVEDLRRCFEFEMSDGSDTIKLFNAWNGQTRDRQAQLLQYLSVLGMLQVESGASVSNPDDRDATPVEFTESPEGERAKEKWAEDYDALNGAPESDDDR